MPVNEMVLRGSQVLTADGLRAASIHVSGGQIGRVRGFDQVPRGANLVEAGDALVFPGLVDTHVHVNEPGRADWEGFASATRAAAAGGVTTLLDMPLNSIPATTSVAALEAKRAAARGRCAVDTGFLGGLVPDNAGEVIPLHSAGVFGFKCFLCPSGVDEFPAVSPADLRQGAPALAALDALLMVHAEWPPVLERHAAASGDRRSYATWLATRPVEAETEAVRFLIDLARGSGLRVHVVHASAVETVELIGAARAAGVRITVETCPHYLGFAAEEIPAGATEYKCAPPIREARQREALWDALARGRLDAVVSDHSPVPPGMKRREEGDFLGAWGGIASLQLRLPAVWTEARARGHAPERLAKWLCEGPARLAGLGGRKGAIAPGSDADLVLWRPEEEFVVDESMLRHRHRLTPWLGRTLAGVVEATYLRGERVYARGAADPPARGRLLTRFDS
ncbi:MAG: allantoinase AllB [Gemmatimonadales bacterium]|nr:allantoinase AllB [Gemmatimonadales bacterium]